MRDKTILPGRGQTWTHRSTQKTTEIHGRRMSAVIHLSAAAHGYVETPVSEFLKDYEYTGCDHGSSCCTFHNEHTMPHTGCILR